MTKKEISLKKFKMVVGTTLPTDFLVELKKNWLTDCGKKIVLSTVTDNFRNDFLNLCAEHGISTDFPLWFKEKYGLRSIHRTVYVYVKWDTRFTAQELEARAWIVLSRNHYQHEYELVDIEREGQDGKFRYIFRSL